MKKNGRWPSLGVIWYDFDVRITCGTCRSEWINNLSFDQAYDRTTLNCDQINSLSIDSRPLARIKTTEKCENINWNRIDVHSTSTKWKSKTKPTYRGSSVLFFIWENNNQISNEINHGKAKQQICLGLIGQFSPLCRFLICKVRFLEATKLARQCQSIDNVPKVFGHSICQFLEKEKSHKMNANIDSIDKYLIICRPVC